MIVDSEAVSVIIWQKRAVVVRNKLCGFLKRVNLGAVFLFCFVESKVNKETCAIPAGID